MSTTTWQRKSEAPELGAAIIRQLRGLVARATEGDLEAIEQLRIVEAQAGTHVGLAVAGARAHVGYSWAELAPALGTTRQSASERFKDVKPLTVVETACGRVTFSRASRFLHGKRCQTCQQLAATVDVQL
jgi:hypothetical protein